MPEDVEGLTVRYGGKPSAPYTDSAGATEPFQSAPQIAVALSELEKQSQILADISRKLQDRLGPVMSPKSVANEISGKKDKEHYAPLANGMNLVRDQMQDTYYLLENILQSLEV